MLRCDLDIVKKKKSDQKEMAWGKKQRKHLRNSYLHRHLSVHKNCFSVCATDEALSEHVQTVDRQGLAGQHVCGLQAALTGVAAEPGAEGLAPTCWGHSAAREDAVVPAAWMPNTQQYNVMSLKEPNA